MRLGNSGLCGQEERRTQRSGCWSLRRGAFLPRVGERAMQSLENAARVPAQLSRLPRRRRLCARAARRCPAFRLDVSIRATSTTPPPPPPTLPSTAYSAFLKLVDLSSGPSPVDFIRSGRCRARARARSSIAFPWHTVMKIYGGALRGYVLRRIIETAYCRARKLLEVFKHAIPRCGKRGETPRCIKLFAKRRKRIASRIKIPRVWSTCILSSVDHLETPRLPIVPLGSSRIVETDYQPVISPARLRQ